ncbi:hypothetical protein AB3X91_00060 [Paraburkholderia sp. BR14263]|uniref:hypothetical protein n=1 Tax=unclassified Paraburkholderia TaxID=2615204 RepID=UPI0034CDDC32
MAASDFRRARRACLARSEPELVTQRGHHHRLLVVARIVVEVAERGDRVDELARVRVDRLARRLLVARERSKAGSRCST